MGYDKLCEWEYFYSELGQDMATDIREYFIPDFTNWKDHDFFEKGFVHLLRDLKSEESTAPVSPPETPR